jgi:hypothetical protein
VSAWTRTAAAGLVLCVAQVAAADDRPLRLMDEPLSYTDVIDALEPGDRFDLNAQIGFTRSVTSAQVLRERAGAAEGPERERVADSEVVRSQLAMEVDVGLHRDLMAFAGLPLVIGEQRSLALPSGAAGSAVASRLSAPASSGGDAALFGVPFSAPVRAGFDHLTLGVAYAPVTQARHPHLPTWVIVASGERAIGRVLRPCRVTDEGRVCGTRSVSDLDGDGRADGTRGGSSNPGLSRGVSAVELETRASRRYGRFEPYAGMGARVEWASTAKSSFEPGGHLRGAPSTLPPRQLHAALGAAYVPWEHRGRHQRAAFDLRLSARYFSAGRDYSPLFDALGTSSHPDLAVAQPEGVRGAAAAALQASCASADQTDCSVGARTGFTGLTQLSPRLRYAARAALEVQAAEYVRFVFAAAGSWVTPYYASAAEGCGPGSGSGGYAQGLDAASCGARAANPLYRGVIDGPGRRFVIRSEWTLDIEAYVTAQF